MQIKKSVQKWVVKLAGRGDKNSTTEDFTAHEKTWDSAVPQEQLNPGSPEGRTMLTLGILKVCQFCLLGR